jgi:hypothetical protein
MHPRIALFALLSSLVLVFYHLQYTFECHSNLGSFVTSAGLCPAEAVWPNLESRVAHIAAEVHDVCSKSAYSDIVLSMRFMQLLALVYGDPTHNDTRRICTKILWVLNRNCM